MVEKLASFKDLMQAKQDREKLEKTGQPVNQNSVNQLTSVVNQFIPSVVNQQQEETVNQLTNKNTEMVNQLSIEKKFRSRRERKLKGLRLPKQKLEKWELWCFVNKFDFQ